jgi:phosphoglycolate phosphatase-like HAD superfamily hydrolase
VTRIILFDIDQTLIWSGGAGGVAMAQAFHQLFGIEDGFRKIEFSGRSDSAILRTAMDHHGLLDGPDADFPTEMARFQETYYALLEPALEAATGRRVMPGVSELLDALSGRDGVRQGLATGNFRRSAFMKLRHFGLDEHLREGGFGDDAEERPELVRVAIERMAGGAPADPASIWVIGDTPLDIGAARANGVRSLGVATGPCSVEELSAGGADLALPDLSDTDSVLSALLG